MTGNVAKLVAAYAGRPILMHRPALEALVQRIKAVDARAFERPGRLDALLRKLSGTRKQVLAMDDDESAPRIPLHEQLAYSPRYIGDADDAGYCWTLKDGIALMCADTPLSAHGDEFCGIAYHGYDTLLSGMREAASDARVKGIFLRADSPGGVAADGIVRLSKWMRENRAAAGGKPIWVYADQACSAMYWVVAQSDRIIGASMGYVASIGCYMVHEDYSGAYAEHGIKITDIASDEKKTDGADWKPLSESAYADLKAYVLQIRNNFVADVTAGRAQLTADKIIALKAASLMTDHAEAEHSGLAQGFVDEIMGEEDAFLALREKVSKPAASFHLTPAAPAGSAAANKENTMSQPDTATPPAAQASAVPPKAAAATETPAATEDPAGGEEEDEKRKRKDGESDEDYQARMAALDAEESDNEAQATNEATAITNSKEAQAEPQMALAAIRDGLTLKQFQGQVAAKETAPRGGNVLARALANAPRLGPDAPAVDGGSQLGKALIENAQKRGGKRS